MSKQDKGGTASSRKLFDRATALMLRKKPDVARAAAMFERARRGGCKDADYALATWYLHGFHFRKSLTKGIALLREAAEAGVADACMDLAIAYGNGEGVKRSERKAAALYLQAALAYSMQPKALHMYSFSEAAWQVARCYWHGLGVKADRRIARIWRDYSDNARPTKKHRKIGPHSEA